MAVYLAAGAAALAYLLAMPVRAGLAWRSGEAVRIGIAIGPLRFSARGGLVYLSGIGPVASLTHGRSGKKRELPLFNRSSDAAALSALASAGRYLLARTHPHRLRAIVRVSLSDAAQTALIYGALDTCLRTLRAVQPRLPLTASITADFYSGRTQFDLCGILSCRFGHIMVAGLIALRDYLSGRFHTWTANSRSKAS